MLAPRPPSALLVVRAAVFISHHATMCLGCLNDGSTLAQSSARGRDIGEGLYAARDLREGNPKVPLALFLGSVIGFCTQDPFAYFVICHCLGFSNCTKLNLFIIRK